MAPPVFKTTSTTPNLPWSNVNVVDKTTSPAITGTSVNMTYMKAKSMPAFKSHGSITTLMALMKENRISSKSLHSPSPMILPSHSSDSSYAAARSSLGACGYHEELLPTLLTAQVGFDVRNTPIVDEDLITVGKTMEMDDPPRDHWQTQHDTLGMNLYPCD
jgi:hypothetical protein